ncbi:MAG: MFS transporter [Longimicrobiales bacterium]
MSSAAPTDAPDPQSPQRAAFRALRHHNFRLFTVGQSLSLIGTWMQSVAVGWLVYRMTDSAFLLGLVSFVGQAPGFFITPFAGVLADRLNKRRIIIVAQALMMLQAVILSVLVLTGHVTIIWIICLMAVLGALSGFEIPARQSFLIEMVSDRDDLPNAIALNSSMFNGARLVGPAIAGFAIAAVGEGWVILGNAISYVFVIASLFLMRVAPQPQGSARGEVLRTLQAGFRYAYDFIPIRAILMLVTVVALAGVPFTVLLPIVAREVLHGDARTLGFLMSATGLGALSGALFLATRTTVVGLGRLIAVAAAVFGASLIALSLSHTLWISLICLTLAGFGMMLQMASCNTILQTLVDDDKRGRVMSMYSMSYIGMAPLGSLLQGAAAAKIGVAWTLAIGGVITIAVGILFGVRLPALRLVVWPIYRRLGILPEVAAGIDAATTGARNDASTG